MGTRYPRSSGLPQLLAQAGRSPRRRTNWFTDDVPAEVQELINGARSTSDAETRRELFTALQEYNQQSGPYAPFNVPQVQTAYQSNLQGYINHPPVDAGYSGFSAAGSNSPLQLHVGQPAAGPCSLSIHGVLKFQHAAGAARWVALFCVSPD